MYRNLRRIRLSLALTQEKLSTRAKITKRYYQDVESGRKSPTVKVVVRLRRALGCEWDDLFKGL